MVAVAVGGAFSVALKSDGTVLEWGMNWCGQLGNGSNLDTSSPVRAARLTRVVAIAAGDQHTLALKADGSVWAWGWVKEGELGNKRKHSESRTDASDGPIQRDRNFGFAASVARSQPRR